MKIWFDTEFIEDGATIALLSIGMVREDGKTLYLETNYTVKDSASDWVRENVFPYLNGDGISREEIAQQIHEFAGNDPEFWAYYASYDWVALCQLYGTMIELPGGWPMFCCDLKQAMDAAGVERIPIANPREHHALADALWTRDAHLWLMSYTS